MFRSISTKGLTPKWIPLSNLEVPVGIFYLTMRILWFLGGLQTLKLRELTLFKKYTQFYDICFFMKGVTGLALNHIYCFIDAALLTKKKQGLGLNTTYLPTYIYGGLLPITSFLCTKITLHYILCKKKIRKKTYSVATLVHACVRYDKH